jgi:hypothetical protein
MASFAKANATMRDLGDKLSKRFAGQAGLNTIRQAVDAQGWPMLFLSHGGNEAEGQPVCLIRMKGVPMVSPDVFGNPLTAYTPHTLEVAYELAATNKPEVATSDLFIVDFESMACGVRMQLKEIANGTAVTEASLNAAAITVDIENLYWPTKSN